MKLTIIQQTAISTGCFAILTADNHKSVLKLLPSRYEQHWGVNAQ